MLIEAARSAQATQARNVTWRRMRAEELPADLPPPRVVTFAQSFHWMDRRRVAAAVRDLLIPGGAVVHVHAKTHQGVDTDVALPHPKPPRVGSDLPTSALLIRQGVRRRGPARAKLRFDPASWRPSLG